MFKYQQLLNFYFQPEKLRVCSNCSQTVFFPPLIPFQMLCKFPLGNVSKSHMCEAQLLTQLTHFHIVLSHQPSCFLFLLQLVMLFDVSCQLLYVPPPSFFRGLLFQKETQWGILRFFLEKTSHDLFLNQPSFQCTQLLQNYTYKDLEGLTKDKASTSFRVQQICICFFLNIIT